MKKKILYLAIGLFMPATAFASSHIYTCSNFPSPSTAGCSNDGSGNAVGTFIASQFLADHYGNTPDFDLLGSGWEITVTLSGSGDAYAYIDNPAGGTGSVHFTSSGTYSLADNSGQSRGNLVLQSNTYIGTISSICVDNDGSHCIPPSPSPSPTGSTTPVSGNTYIFLATSMFLFMVELFAILVILFIVMALTFWPVKLFIRRFRQLIRRAR